MRVVCMSWVTSSGYIRKARTTPAARGKRARRSLRGAQRLRTRAPVARSFRGERDDDRGVAAGARSCNGLGRARTAPASNAGNHIYRPFFTAGIAVALTVGASWGVWLLWQIGFARRFTGVSLHQVNAHGHAQVFGWVGLFVMGFAYQMFPAIWQRRLAAPRLVPFVFAAMLSGIVLRTVAMATAGAGWAVPAVVVGGALEIAAIGRSSRSWPSAGAAASRAAEPYLRFVGAALWLLPGAGHLLLWHTVSAMRAADRDALLWQVATYQAVLRDLQIHGFALLLILGVSMRILPRFYGLARDRRTEGAGAPGGCCCWACSARPRFFSFTDSPAATSWPPPCWCRGGCWPGARSPSPFVFRPWRPFPVPDRSAKFVRFAYLWLAASFALLLLLPVYQARRPPPVQPRLLRFDSPRDHRRFRVADDHGRRRVRRPHAAARDRAALPGLGGPFLLINLGCLLRVTLQALTDVHPAFFAVVGVSGVLELAALGWWGRPSRALDVRAGQRPSFGRPCLPHRLAG